MYRSINARSRAATLLEAQIYRAVAVPMNMLPPSWAVTGPSRAIIRAPAIRKLPPPSYDWSIKLGPLASDIWS